MSLSVSRNALALAAAFAVLVAARPLGAADFVWATKHVDLPTEEPMFAGKGADLLNQNCIACHSSIFVEEQPTLPLATWKAEVLKMRKVFGASIEEGDVDAIAATLAEHRGKPGG